MIAQQTNILVISKFFHIFRNIQIFHKGGELGGGKYLYVTKPLHSDELYRFVAVLFGKPILPAEVSNLLQS